MAIVFQYGSNTHSDRLNSDNRLWGDARPIGTAYTEDDYQVDFTTWSERSQCAAADLVAGSGRKIWGVLFEIPDHLISNDTAGNRRSFDAIEGKNYQRIQIRLRHPNGSPVAEDVMTYVVIDKKGDIRTSLEYVRHIIIGLRENNVPDEYIEYMKMRVAANNPGLEQDIREL